MNEEKIFFQNMSSPPLFSRDFVVFWSMRLEKLKNKKILILGFGREGKDNFLALRKLFPDKVLGIADELEFKKLPKSTQKLLEFDKKVKLYFGKDYLKSLKNYDLIIKTPGIPPAKIPPLSKRGGTKRARQKLTSQTEIFFDNCQDKIIGVTGTKGKGTTASLIYQILKKGGLKVHLIGNIGKPVFQTLLKAKPGEIFVYEISSHQLQNLKKSPQIAVFLNIWPAHLDYYKNFKQYQKAKENITKWQTKDNFFIYNSDEKPLKEIAKKTKAKKIPIPTNYEFLTNIRIPLIGKFNLKNVMAAVRTGELFNVPKKKIKEAIKSFRPLSHRLEFVRKYKGIAFYNDSLATVPQATMAALEGLGDKVKTLILGGSESGVDFSPLVKKIFKSKIKTLIFLSPGTGEEIWKVMVQQVHHPKAFFVSSMKKAVEIAYQKTNRGEICLLSPGAPSFNLFQDYKQRGNLFKKYIKQFGYERKKSS